MVEKRNGGTVEKSCRFVFVIYYKLSLSANEAELSV